MWNHYWRVFKELPAAYREAKEFTEFWMLSAIAIVAFFWPRVDAIQSRFPLPHWIAPGAFVLAMTYLFLRVNYRHVQAAELRLAEMQTELGSIGNLGPTILGMWFHPQPESPGEFDVTADMLMREPSAFPDGWLLRLRLSDGRTTDVRGRFNAHSIPQGRIPVTVHFPFGQTVPNAAALQGATLLAIEGTDMRGRRFGYTRPTDKHDPEAGQPVLDLHVALGFAVLWTEVEQHTDSIVSSGYMFAFHGFSITNRSDQDMSLDFAVDLSLVKPAIISEAMTVALTPLQLEGRKGAFHSGVLHVPAKQTKTINMAFLLQAHHASGARGIANIADSGHVLTIADRVSGRSRREQFPIHERVTPTESSSGTPLTVGAGAATHTTARG